MNEEVILHFPQQRKNKFTRKLCFVILADFHNFAEKKGRLPEQMRSALRRIP